MKEPKVTIILLNWNGRDDTLECLASLRRIDYRNFDILVVDNGSGDDSVPTFRESFPDVVVLEMGGNLGFAGGNNVGMRYAIEKGAEYVLLLNNDTVVDNQLIRSFLDAYALVSEGGIFGAKIYYFNEPNKLWFAGASWINSISRFDHIGQNSIDKKGLSRSLVETDYACGCALFTSADILRRIGLFDERFFLTFEEADLCCRARRLGCKSFLVPGAKVWHKVSSSFGGENSPLFQYFLARNVLLWAKKHLPLSGRLVLYRRVAFELLRYYLPPRFHLDNSIGGTHLTIIYRSLIKYIREFRSVFARKFNNPQRRARLWAMRDYLLHRFGNCTEDVRMLGK